MTVPYLPRLDLLLLGTDEFGSALGVTISMPGVVEDAADKLFPCPTRVALRKDTTVGAAFDLARGQLCGPDLAILSMHPTRALSAGEP